MTTFTARPFFQPESEELRFLPESPRVLSNSGMSEPLLAWVAIQHSAGSRGGSFNLVNLKTGLNRTFALPGRPGFLVETTKPGIVALGLEHRIVLVNTTNGAVTETGVSIAADDRVIINDGIAIPGGLLFGTKHLEFNQPIAALYHYDCATRRMRELVGGQYCSNGKFFTKDESGCTLIDIDSTPKKITRYRFDSGLQKVIDSSPVVDPDQLPAFPDGLRPTAGGSSIVVAFYNPAHVSDGLAQHVRLSDGAVLDEWILPGSPRVTCPEFVRIDGRVRILFTTALEGMPAETRAIAPNAGALFLADTPFDDLPETPPLVEFD
jgi:sugar lactone lactonase YvrE